MEIKQIFRVKLMGKPGAYIYVYKFKNKLLGQNDSSVLLVSFYRQ